MLWETWGKQRASGFPQLFQWVPTECVGWACGETSDFWNAAANLLFQQDTQQSVPWQSGFDLESSIRSRPDPAMDIHGSASAIRKAFS